MRAAVASLDFITICVYMVGLSVPRTTPKAGGGRTSVFIYVSRRQDGSIWSLYMTHMIYCGAVLISDYNTGTVIFRDAKLFVVLIKSHNF